MDNELPWGPRMKLQGPSSSIDSHQADTSTMGSGCSSRGGRCWRVACWRVTGLLLLLLQSLCVAQECSNGQPLDPCAAASATPLDGVSWAAAYPVAADPVVAADDAMACCQRCNAAKGCAMFDYDASSKQCRIVNFADGPLGLASGSESAALGGQAGVDGHLLPTPVWNGMAWTGDIPFAIQEGLTSGADCAALCAATCGCTYWTHHLGTGKCEMTASLSNSGQAPRLSRAADAAAGLVLDPNLELQLQGASVDWDKASFSDTYSLPAGTGRTTHYQEPASNSDKVSELRVDSQYTGYNWTDAQALWRVGQSQVEVDLSEVPEDKLGGSKPGYMDTPLLLTLPLDGSNTSGAANYSIKLDSEQNVPKGRMQGFEYGLELVDVEVPVELSFSVARCSSSSQPQGGGGGPLGAAGSMAANLSTSQVLRRNGFCGDEGGLSEGDGSGDITITGMLQLTLPLRMTEVKKVDAGVTCPVSLDVCATAAAQLPETRWAAPPLSSGLASLESAGDCCSACSASPKCVFWDYASSSGRCSMYDWSLSLMIYDAAGRSSSNLLTSVARAGLPLITGEQDMTAGMLDSKQYPGQRWSMDPDAEASIPPATNPAAFCAAQCATLCGCTYWAASEQQQMCSLYKSKAQGGSLLAAPGWTAGIKFGRSLQFSAPVVQVDWNVTTEGEPYDGGMITASMHNPSSNTANVTDLIVPAEMGWDVLDTLYYDYASAPGQGLLLNLIGISSEAQGGVQNDTLGPLDHLPISQGNTTVLVYVQSSLPSSVEVPAFSSRQVQAKVTRTQVTIPALLSYTVSRCEPEAPTDVAALQEIGDATSMSVLGQIASVQAQPAARFDQLVDSLLGVEALLQRGGSCALMTDGKVAADMGADAFLQVQATATLQMPTKVEEPQVLASDAPDATGCSPAFDADLPAAELYPGSCNPVSRWQECCDLCRSTAQCLTWTYYGPASALGGATCNGHCALKGGAGSAAPVSAPGLVTGSVVAGADACSPVMQDYHITFSSGPLATDFMPSLGRCCQMCGRQQGCAAFVYNWTGECMLYDGSISTGQPAEGVSSGMRELLGQDQQQARRRALAESDSCMAAPGQVPSPGGLLGLVKMATSYKRSWQDLCCFNSLSDCGEVTAGQQLLVPCAGQADGSCSAAGAVETDVAARTLGGCRCASRYTYTDPDGRRYEATGACMAGVPAPEGAGDDVTGPWCIVDESTCGDASATFGAGDGQRGAACEQGGDATDSAAGGCALMPGISLLQVSGDGAQAAPGIDDGALAVVGSEAACCALCHSTPGCGFFTFVKASGQCWLKQQVSEGARVPVKTIAMAGTVSGVRGELQTSGASGLVASPAAGRRRRALAESAGTCVPGVFPLLAGESLANLPEGVIPPGTEWQAVCCVNNAITNCTDTPTATTLLIPCLSPDGGDVSSEGSEEAGSEATSCAATGNNVTVVIVPTYKSTNTVIPVAVGLGVSVVALAAGLLVGYAASRAMLKRRRAQMKLRAAGLEYAHSLAFDSPPPSSSGGSVSGTSVSSKGVSRLRMFSAGRRSGASGTSLQRSGSEHSRYDWDAGSVSSGKSGGTVVIGGHLRTAGSRPIVAKFYSNQRVFEHERLYYKSNPAPGYVPDVYDVFPGVDGAHPALVEERGDYSLATWLMRAGKAPSAAQHRVSALRQVAEALAAMHAGGVVHGNVFPGHVMWFNEAHRWKLVGLGAWAGVGEEVAAPSPNSIDIRYAAPEVARAIREKRPFVVRPASDMWSLGCMVWEACTGEPLFPATMSEDDIMTALVGDGPLPFEKHRVLWMAFEEDQARRLAQHLLRRSPNERWHADRALGHALLKSADTTKETTDALRKARGRVQALYARVRELRATQASALRSHVAGSLLVSTGLEEVLGDEGASTAGIQVAVPATEAPATEAPATEAAAAKAKGLAGPAAAPQGAAGDWTIPAVHTGAPGDATAAGKGGRETPETQYQKVGREQLQRPAFPEDDSARMVGGAPAYAAAGAGGRGQLPAVPEADKGALVKEALHDMYLRGCLPVELAPTTLLSLIAEQQGDDNTPVFLLRSERQYIIRLQVQFGTTDKMHIPVDGAEHCLVLSDASDDETVLPVHAIKAKCTPYVWHGFAIWDTDGMPSGVQEVELAVALRLKSTMEVVQVRKRLEVQVHPPSATFSVERAGAKVADMWADAPDWVRLAAFGVTKLFAMSSSS